jgi:hypothetical protein
MSSPTDQLVDALGFQDELPLPVPSSHFRELQIHGDEELCGSYKTGIAAPGVRSWPGPKQVTDGPTFQDIGRDRQIRRA